MGIGVIGFDYHRTSIHLREQLAISTEMMPALYESLSAHPAVAEVVILSTCNRTEVYYSNTSTATCKEAASAIQTYFTHAPSLPTSDVAPYLYHKQNQDAIVHLFQVTAGLHSMVIGETQVIGQVREAFALARVAHVVGEELSQLFTSALKTGKRVRAETEVGRADTSVSTACLELIKQVLPQVKGSRAVLVGAGKISRMCAKLLRKAGAGQLLFANRTAGVAAGLATEFGGTTIRLRDLSQYLSAVDLVISATAAPHLIITAAELAQATSLRRDPLYLFDLALPRDIDPEAAHLPLVRLYDLDALVPYGIAQSHSTDLAKMHSLVEEGIEDFLRWQAARRAVPAISALSRQIELWEASELHETFAKLSHLSTAEQDAVRQFGDRLTAKLFYELVMRIKSAAASAETTHYLEAIEYLFDISANDNTRRRSSRKC